MMERIYKGSVEFRRGLEVFALTLFLSVFNGFVNVSWLMRRNTGYCCRQKHGVRKSNRSKAAAIKLEYHRPLSFDWNGP